jgi:hypothetical protein
MSRSDHDIDVFGCRLVLKPLQELPQADAPGQIVILLDALNEADHDNGGWEPVGHLLAKE